MLFLRWNVGKNEHFWHTFEFNHLEVKKAVREICLVVFLGTFSGDNVGKVSRKICAVYEENQNKPIINWFNKFKNVNFKIPFLKIFQLRKEQYSESFFNEKLKI